MPLRRILTVFLFSSLMMVVQTSSGFGQARITAEEYSMYAIVLKEIYREQRRTDHKKYLMVLLSRSSSEPVPELSRADQKPPGWKRDKRMKGLWENFDRRNKLPVSFQHKFPVKFGVEIVDREQIAVLIEKGKIETENEERNRREKLGTNYISDASTCGPFTWKYFYQRFPRANQFYQFSRIGYSANRRYAVVEATGEGFGSGSNWTYWLIRTTSGWKVYQASGGFRIC